MKETLDGAGRLWSAWEHAMHVLASLGLAGFGAVLFVGPAGIAEEIPPHRAVGIGVGALGVVMLLALVLKGRGGARVRRLLGALVLGVVASILGLGAWREGRIVHGLHAEGELRTLTVESSTMNFSGQGAPWKVTFVDGGRRVVLDGDTRLERGTRTTLLVHPEHPTWTAVVDEGAGLLEIAEARESRLLLVATGAGAVLAAIAAVAALGSALFGRVDADPS